MNRSDAEAMNACEDYDCNDDDAFSWSRREAARIKQIQIGKARPEYQRYIREVQPSRRHSSQPGTPDPRARVSKRQFDRALGDWRRRLHEFDAVPRCVRGQPGQEAEVLAGPSSNGQLSGKGAWGSPEKKGAGKGAFGKANPQLTEERAGPRSTNRRARGGAVLPVTRGERCGKFGPRKQADSHDVQNNVDPLPLTAPPMPPPPPPPTAAPSCVGDVAAPQVGAVRISLADQLMEMPMQPMVPPPPEWQWYQNPEALWGTMETPQKNPMMGMDPQFMMTMETPPDKPMMPGHSMTSQMYDKNGMLKDVQFMAMEAPTDPTSFQQMYNDSMLKVPMDQVYGLDGMGMSMDYALLPNRLFDSSPEKSEHMNESHSSNSELEGGDTTQSADQVPESPRSRPRTLTDSLLMLKSPCMASPSVRFNSALFSSPMPATPKRPFYVPETPSPDRMHWSSMQPHALPYGQPAPLQHPASLGGLPWGAMGGCPLYGAQAHEQVIPEFLQMQQMMPMMNLNELQPFGELAPQ